MSSRTRAKVCDADRWEQADGVATYDLLHDVAWVTGASWPWNGTYHRGQSVTAASG